MKLSNRPDAFLDNSELLQEYPDIFQTYDVIVACTPICTQENEKLYSTIIQQLREDPSRAGIILAHLQKTLLGLQQIENAGQEQLQCYVYDAANNNTNNNPQNVSPEGEIA